MENLQFENLHGKFGSEKSKEAESRLPRNELISSLVRLQAGSVNISFHDLPRQ